jgi:hypothetical protein
MALDSKAAFQQKASQIETPVQEIDALELERIYTFAKFCSEYKPGGPDEKPLVTFLETTLGEVPNGEMMSQCRRLFFESQALCLQDLRQKVERTEHSDAKVLPLAEKVEKINQLKVRLPARLITQQLEPSHRLVDKAVQQWEGNGLRYLELTACTNREPEVLAEKSTPSLTFGSTGNIEVTKKQELTQRSLTGDLRLRTAMQTRTLAYELAGVASFVVMEKWANLLFEKLQQDPPRGYRYVAHDELLRADKALRLHVAEETRAQVQGNGLKKPVDEGIEKWSLHAEIQYHIMPLPAAPHGASVTKPAASSATATAKPVVKDNDCEIKFGHQRPIRMKHNIGICRGNVKPGKRCQYGFHVCWKKQCHKPHSAVENHIDTSCLA